MVLMDKSFTMTLRTRSHPLPFRVVAVGGASSNILHGQDPVLTTVAQGSQTPFSPATLTNCQRTTKPARIIYIC
jgi:hypothetical protein